MRIPRRRRRLVYAPGLTTAEQIETVVDAVGVPVNVLAWPTGPSVPEIGRAGGRRVSTGGSLASTAYGALMAGARELLDPARAPTSSTGCCQGIAKR